MASTSGRSTTLVAVRMLVLTTLFAIAVMGGVAVSITYGYLAGALVAIAGAAAVGAIAQRGQG